MQREDIDNTDKKKISEIPIKGFERYTLTEDGRVFTIHRKRKIELYYSHHESSSGEIFISVEIFSPYRKYRKYIHRLVHENFNGSKNRPYHKDHNCFNNHYSNLTDDPPVYELEGKERWLEGYEGRYFTVNGEVYSVYKRLEPKKLKPSSYFKKKKYTLVREDGKKITYYFEETTV